MRELGLTRATVVRGTPAFLIEGAGSDLAPGRQGFP